VLSPEAGSERWSDGGVGAGSTELAVQIVRERGFDQAVAIAARQLIETDSRIGSQLAVVGTLEMTNGSGGALEDQRDQ
jgi:hypothetical protein